MKLEFFRRIFEKFWFHENPTSGSRIVSCGQAGGRVEANRRFRQFCEQALKVSRRTSQLICRFLFSLQHLRSQKTTGRSFSSQIIKTESSGTTSFDATIFYQHCRHVFLPTQRFNWAHKPGEFFDRLPGFVCFLQNLVLTKVYEAGTWS